MAAFRPDDDYTPTQRGEPVNLAGVDARRSTFCECETPVMDVERDAGCRRCGRPVDFTFAPLSTADLWQLVAAEREAGRAFSRDAEAARLELAKRGEQ